jgi:hypothetical protein
VTGRSRLSSLDPFGLLAPLWRLDPRRLPGPLGALGKKEVHLWLGAWLEDRAKKLLAPAVRGTRHLLFSVCDHYEPLHGGVSMTTGIARVARWRTRYPALGARFEDTNGRPPRHSYFFPGEQYDARLVEPLAELCELGLGEVEVHLHHDADTRATLAASLEKTLTDLAGHGLISRAPGDPSKFQWAFIHGNWCLANGRRDGRWCGVDDEMELLWELGCYVDLTFPSAPDQCQPGVVNQIYYPRGDVRRRRAYEDAEPAQVGTPRRDRLLMIEGPLALARRPGSRAVRIESSALDASDPPSPRRLETWVNQNITIEGRPEWTFVKVHTHGAPENNAEIMLGERIAEMHRLLGERYNDGTKWKLHYVTAREMYNVARAAMDGKSGSPAQWLDYEIAPPPRAPTRYRQDIDGGGMVGGDGARDEAVM